MDYTHLTAKDATGLRHERVHRLEVEHYRVRLALEEADEDANAQAQVELADLERRIGLHREVLGIVVPPPDGVELGGPAEPDTPGSGDEAHDAENPAHAGPMTAAADYQDGPHEDTGSAPEGLETKSIDPEFASTTTHRTDGGDAAAEPAEGGDEAAAAPGDGDAEQDGGEPVSSHAV